MGRKDHQPSILKENTMKLQTFLFPLNFLKILKSSIPVNVCGDVLIIPIKVALLLTQWATGLVLMGFIIQQNSTCYIVPKIHLIV